MRALRFEKTGSLDFLDLRDVPKPAPAAGEVLIRVKAAAINPSDIKNVLGKMHETTLPRIPGRDFSGIVVEGPQNLVGRAVFGSGGDLGFGRDGSHAEFLTLPRAAVSPMPQRFSFEQAAAVGLAYLTAWLALMGAAQLQAGETVLILGTTGSVGSAAAAIARRRGARVLGNLPAKPRTSQPQASCPRMPGSIWKPPNSRTAYAMPRAGRARMLSLISWAARCFKKSSGVAGQAVQTNRPSVPGPNRWQRVSILVEFLLTKRIPTLRPGLIGKLSFSGNRGRNLAGPDGGI